MLKVIALIALLMFGTLAGLVLFPPPSSDFQHSPLADETLKPELKAELTGIPNAASLLWQTEKQQWLIGTLAPQTVMVNGSAQLAYLNPQLKRAELVPLPTSGDIADLTMIDQHLLAISADGRLLFFSQAGEQWKFIDKRKWLKGGLIHKTAGVIWDSQAKQLYSCEREGLKRCYRGNREGQQASSFDLVMADPNQQQSLQEYQLGSMAWHQGNWYILSPRFSSLLKVDQQSGQVLKISALAQPDTAQAIASNGKQLWLLSVTRQQPDRVKLSTIPLSTP
ncbi:hypothetical protein [Agarivorans sp. Z349TD_8]|uniref:hypothetical protein n=1 Tax=Agarivorans sp. Z349TD_8 TaxID=3421434 RepID=UPI003D7D5683